MNLRVTLLGTGGSAGIPMIGGADARGDRGDCDPAQPRNRRSRASITVEGADGQRLLVDTAPDLRTQLLENGIGRVDAVLFTHQHADHITGIDDVRILNRLIGRPLQGFGTEKSLAEITTRFGYAFKPWQGKGFYRPALTPIPVEPGPTPVRIAGLDLVLFRQDHGMIESLGLRVGRFAYSTDVVRLDDSAFESLTGVDTWVVGCFTRGAPHPTHANLATALAWARRVGARRTILTHMGTDMDYDWLLQNLPQGVEPGHDGMVLEIPG